MDTLPGLDAIPDHPARPIPETIGTHPAGAPFATCETCEGGIVRYGLRWDHPGRDETRGRAPGLALVESLDR